MDVTARIKEIICEHLDVEQDKVTPDTTFEELDADSLDVVELVMSLEEEFELEIPDDEVEKIKSIGDVINYIEAHL